jgi:hypothetical protein
MGRHFVQASNWRCEVKALIKVAGTGTLILGAAGLILAGYVFLASLPDLKRYIRISTM